MPGEPPFSSRQPSPSAGRGQPCARSAAGDEGADEPADLAAIGRPRVGFVGGIDAHTFDPELFLAVARALPDVQFVLVGSCSLPEDWCTLPNVHLMGKRPYEEVSRYMAASDVLIMPWNKSDWIEACNPVKLKEYLAVGRPIVSTGFYELRSYEGLVRVASTAEEFATEIRAALRIPDSRHREGGREQSCAEKDRSTAGSVRSPGQGLAACAFPSERRVCAHPASP